MPAEPEPVPGAPPLRRVSEPVISVGDRQILVQVEDADGQAVELRFRPYQALRVTTMDCVSFAGSRPQLDRLTFRRESPWMDELASTLKRLDPGATFMDHALHFMLGPGDDLVEIVAWRVEIGRAGTSVGAFPEDAAPSPLS